MQPLIEGNKFAKESYIISKRHRIFKVLITPPHCLMDDETRAPAYMLMLVGSQPEHAFKMEKEKVEKEHDRYVQRAKECLEVTAPIYKIDQFILHVGTGGIYQITDLPSDCVLEHNRKPAYGYRMPDGRRCFRSQIEVEDQNRFTRMDTSLALVLLAVPEPVEA